MAIIKQQKAKILEVINVFETGSPQGKYDSITILQDGPVLHGEKVFQITYGRSQTTEFGNLKRLLALYIARNGKFKSEFQLYLDKCGQHPSLRTDEKFKNLLIQAAREDSIMQEVQDEFFDTHYFQPALNWFNQQGFQEALSLLVIYDSFIHSGGILKFLRQRFPEKTPANGGDEKTWITQYVEVRHEWLRTHANPILRNTVYRTECFKKQIQSNNWDLAQPVDANRLVLA